jgi:hypothetical protein
MFQTAEEWGEFYDFWFSILSSPTEETYKERLKDFEKKYTLIKLE